MKKIFLSIFVLSFFASCIPIEEYHQTRCYWSTRLDRVCIELHENREAINPFERYDQVELLQYLNVKRDIKAWIREDYPDGDLTQFQQAYIDALLEIATED